LLRAPPDRDFRADERDVRADRGHVALARPRQGGAAAADGGSRTGRDERVEGLHRSARNGRRVVTPSPTSSPVSRLPSHDVLSWADIADARRRIAGVAHRTPVLRSGQFDEACGATVFFKAENLQRAGAFKFRGAYNKIRAEQEKRSFSEIVAYS